MLRVHSYESMGTFDGPGLRLVVFLQGCNFRCLYCANPDTIEAGAGTLTDPAEILRMAVDQKPFFRAARRRDLLGRGTHLPGRGTRSARKVVEGGRHPRLHRLERRGWNPAVEELLGLVDLVLLDVKQADPERHRALTGRENAQTLRTAAWLEAHGKPFWLRYVLVPGISDAEADIRALGERLGGYKSVERVELLPYHTLGVHKYEAMGLEYKLRDVRENTPEQLDRAAALLARILPDGGGQLTRRGRPPEGVRTTKNPGRRGENARRSRIFFVPSPEIHFCDNEEPTSRPERPGPRTHRLGGPPARDRLLPGGLLPQLRRLRRRVRQRPRHLPARSVGRQFRPGLRAAVRDDVGRLLCCPCGPERGLSTASASAASSWRWSSGR